MKLTIKNIFGAGLFALAFSVGATAAAAAESCAVPPTCDSLGYTKTASACSGMATLKCPFDTSKVFCVSANESPTGSCTAPQVGDILYSDMSCSSSANVDTSKTAIGVIFDPSHRLAIALKQTTLVGNTFKLKEWSTEYDDIPDLPNYTTEDMAKADVNGKSNTKTIVDYCQANGKSCPAAEYANSYTTKGTTAGDWYLPALGELILIYSRKEKLNPVLTSLGGMKLRYGSIADDIYWSSSESDDVWVWIQNFNEGDISCYGKSNPYGHVRPVLAF